MICYYKVVSCELTLQKFDLSKSVDSDRVVLYRSADHLRDAALSEKARTAVICLQLGDIILKFLDL